MTAAAEQQLTEQAAALLPGQRVQFLGKIPRLELYQYYSAADIFAFPGIEESLGMVYLEAQSCNLPVVAYQDWGGGETVVDEQTGLLSPAATPSLFTTNIAAADRRQDQSDEHLGLRPANISVAITIWTGIISSWKKNSEYAGLPDVYSKFT